VDIDWLKDAMFSHHPKFEAMPEDERAAALGMMGRTPMLWSSVVGTLFALPIFYVLHALYLLVVAKITKLPQGFKHWFALTCWTSLPLLLGTVVSAIFLLMSESAQISPSALQPLSLNELLFHRALGTPEQPLLDSLTIPGFLSWALAIIGVRTWSQRSWVFSTIVVAIPIVLLYGIWSFFAFR
jgi:hypothetical protein